MMTLNNQVDEFTQQVMRISKEESDKLEKRNKFTPRERINRIVDDGSPFLEIGQFAGFE